jgi:alkanesulfonate monooxygenase SsuD/methylene tetrahydromethanopterin reductase-like flavin-dependent oxidoreductase (luciferase family)
VRTGIAVTNFGWTTPLAGELTRVAQTADRGGIDSLFVADHLLAAEPGADPSDPVLEALTLLGFLAAHTERLRLGALVASATLRPPAVLVKAVTTLDALSDGRAWFGIGAGYHRQQADAMGVRFPPTGERYEELEDTLRHKLTCWRSTAEPRNARSKRSRGW